MDDAGEPPLGRAELAGALASTDPAIRSAALRRAGGDPTMEDLVITVLSDPEPDVRRAAAAALGPVAGPGGVRALIRASRGDISVPVRVEAVEAIGRILAARVAR